MAKLLDKRATTQWTKAAISYENYQKFIDNKSEKFRLSLIDLLYVSNFKGGNATINEPEHIINDKLSNYSKIIVEINSKFSHKSLAELDDGEIVDLISLIISICNLTQKGTTTKIDGFSVSYLSALLSSYFPLLIPILDRRVLINLNLVTDKDIDSNGQIKNIIKFYSPLLKEIARLCFTKKLNIREIDKYLFTTKLQIIR